MKPDPKKVDEYFGFISKNWDERFRPKRPGDEFVVYGETDDGDAEPDEEDSAGG